MKIDKKKYFLILGTVFAFILLIKYWNYVVNGMVLTINVCDSLIIGAIIAYVVNIIMAFYEEKIFNRIKNKYFVKCKRAVSLILAFGSIGVFIYLILWLVIPELNSCIEVLIKSVPSAFEKLEKMFNSKVNMFSELEIEDIDWNQITQEVINFVKNGFAPTVGTILGYVSSIVGVVFDFIMGLIFSMYILAQKEKLKAQIIKCMDTYMNPKTNEKILYVYKVVDKCFHSFIVGQCAEAVILGVLCVIGMLIFRFPYAVMIGVLIGCTALIPIAGAYIGGAVGAIMIFTVSPFKALMFIVFLVILQQIEGQLIYPKVVGSSIGLPGIWVFAAVVVGGGLFGITGVLFGIPIFASAYVLLKNDVNNRQLQKKQINSKEIDEEQSEDKAEENENS